MRIKCIIDRIEGEKAVIELPDLTTILFPLHFLPVQASEGQTLILDIETADQNSL